MRLMTLIVSLVLLVSACGPIQVATAVGDAEEAIEAAQRADAERHARYEYWMAILFLDKAKRVDGRAEYEAATEMAIESMNFAKAAVDAAGKEKMRQQVMQQRLKARAKEQP